MTNKIDPYELHPQAESLRVQKKVLTWNTVRATIINMMKEQEGCSTQAYHALHNLLKDLERKCH